MLATVRFTEVRLPAADENDEWAAWIPCRFLLRIHAHGLIAKIWRTRRRRVTNYGRRVMATSLCLREHHFSNVYSGVVHYSSSRKTKNSRQKNLSSEAVAGDSW
jgi:HJR/Mrr/RecB family endonuclease